MNDPSPANQLAPSNTPEYVFWVYTELYPRNFAPDLQKCIIDAAAIRLDGVPTLEYPLADIVDAVVELERRPYSMTSWVKLAFHNSDRRINLRPANPYQPQLVTNTQFHEAKAFVEVVNALRRGHQTSLDPNPYVRQWLVEHKEPPSAAWDKYTSPVDHYRTGKVGISPTKMARRLMIVLGVSLAVVISAALMVNLVTGSGAFWR